MMSLALKSDLDVIENSLREQLYGSPILDVAVATSLQSMFSSAMVIDHGVPPVFRALSSALTRSSKRRYVRAPSARAG